MGKCVTTAQLYIYIIGAVAYKCIGCGNACVAAKDAGVVGVVYNTLLQYQFWVCVYRGTRHANGLKCIFYIRKTHQVVFAIAPEIDARPGGWKIVIRLV